jgi:Rieske Fe-S protein
MAVKKIVIQPELERRTVLLGAGAAGIAGVLAACGGNDDGNGGNPAATATDDTGTGDVTDEPTDAGSDDDQDGDTAPLVAASDVPVGGGVILADDGVVVTQPEEGEFMGFSSTCTHQGCTVARVDGGQIQCDCHGSRFSIEDGAVENGPATQPLPEVAVSLEGDQIVRA